MLSDITMTRKAPTTEPVSIPWRITKARTMQDGSMQWEATTTRFARDQQGDFVRRGFYEEAIRRFKSGTVPPPFFSVAHYGAQEVCECGNIFKSFNDGVCNICGRDRLLAGVTTDMWIDGRQPKACGVFLNNESGKTVFKACRDDIEKSIPDDERVRVSMGFYPDYNGVLYPSQDQRDFLTGWVEHFAATRVPVVPETGLTVKSLNIKTKYDDAESIVGKGLAQKYEKLGGKRLKSETNPQLIVKAEGEDEDRPEGQDNKKIESSKAVEKDSEQKQSTETGALDQRLNGLGEELTTIVKGEDKSIADNDPIMQDARDALELVQKALAGPGSDKARILTLAANLVSAIRDYAHVLAGDENYQQQMPGQAGPLTNSNETMPPNQPMPPDGQVFDETTTLTPDALAAEGEDVTTPTGIEQVDEAAAQAEAELPDIPMPEEYVQGGDAGVEGDDTETPTDETSVDETQPVDEKVPAEGSADSGGEQPPSAKEKKPAPKQAEASTDQTTDEATPPAKKKITFKKKEEKAARLTELMTKARKTIATESVKAPARKNAAVKSVAVQPVEAFDSILNEFVNGVSVPLTAGAQLTRTQRREAIQKAVTKFLNQASQTIDKTTPTSDEEMQSIVDRKVADAVNKAKSESLTTIIQLQAKVESLTRALTSQAVDQVMKAQTGPRVQRKSIGMAKPVELMSQRPVLQGESEGIKKSSAAEVAAASVMTRPITQIYY